MDRSLRVSISLIKQNPTRGIGCSGYQYNFFGTESMRRLYSEMDLKICGVQILSNYNLE
jgi:hypothetical protein